MRDSRHRVERLARQPSSRDMPTYDNPLAPMSRKARSAAFKSRPTRKLAAAASVPLGRKARSAAFKSRLVGLELAALAVERRKARSAAFRPRLRAHGAGPLLPRCRKARSAAFRPRQLLRSHDVLLGEVERLARQPSGRDGSSSRSALPCPSQCRKARSAAFRPRRPPGTCSCRRGRAERLARQPSGRDSKSCAHSARRRRVERLARQPSSRDTCGNTVCDQTVAFKSRRRLLVVAPRAAGDVRVGSKGSLGSLQAETGARQVELPPFPPGRKARSAAFKSRHGTYAQHPQGRPVERLARQPSSRDSRPYVAAREVVFIRSQGSLGSLQAETAVPRPPASFVARLARQHSVRDNPYGVRSAAFKSRLISRSVRLARQPPSRDTWAIIARFARQPPSRDMWIYYTHRGRRHWSKGSLGSLQVETGCQSRP
jgi:hypothetical protein